MDTMNSSPDTDTTGTTSVATVAGEQGTRLAIRQAPGGSYYTLTVTLPYMHGMQLVATDNVSPEGLQLFQQCLDASGRREKNDPPRFRAEKNAAGKKDELYVLEIFDAGNDGEISVTVHRTRESADATLRDTFSHLFPSRKQGQLLQGLSGAALIVAIQRYAGGFIEISVTPAPLVA